MKHSRFIIFLVAQMLWVNCVAACSHAPEAKSRNVKTEKPVCNDWIHPDQTAYQA